MKQNIGDFESGSEELTLIPVRNWHEWDSLLDASEQKSVFLLSSYLKTSELLSSARYLVEKNKILGGIVIPELYPETLSNPIRSYSTYQSVWFTSEATSGSRKSQDQIEILSKLGRIFLNSGLDLDLSLHWSITDVRGLDWAFFNNQKRKIHFTPRYTGILDLTKFQDFTEYLKTVSSGRKADFRLSSSLNIEKVSDSSAVSHFLIMYEETVPFVDIESKSKALKQVEHLVRDSIGIGSGTLWFAKNHNGEVLSGIFIQKIDDILYYQFGASHKNNLKISPNAVSLLHIIENAFEANISTFDFVGMNSPKRGAFKASLNPEPRLYFEVLIRSK
jgi:hypothetical protein